MPVRVTTPAAAELPELADVAARTFPLACPPSVTPENIVAFIDENLSQSRFAEYLADPDRVVLIAREDGRMVGYVMLIRG
ncbi:MAG: GNAT family N-acetyltransferase, partial [Mycobacterium sp.]